MRVAYIKSMSRNCLHLKASHKNCKAFSKISPNIATNLMYNGAPNVDTPAENVSGDQ